MTTKQPAPSNPRGSRASEAAPATAAEPFHFERALKRLEEIVKKLESPDLELEEAIRLFEEGIRLAQQCQKRLEEAEQRVEILRKRADGKIEAEPFEPEANAKPDPSQ